MTWLAANAPVSVRHCVALRVEFRPVSEDTGPYRDVIVKIFPNGSSTFPGLILGLPSLDVAPYGLGFRICEATYALDTLSVQLPRLDVARRDALNVCNLATSASEEDVQAAWKFLGAANSCNLSWCTTLPRYDGESDSSVESLSRCDAGFRWDGIADHEDAVHIPDGAGAEVPVVWRQTYGQKAGLERCGLIPTPEFVPSEVLGKESPPVRSCSTAQDRTLGLFPATWSLGE